MIIASMDLVPTISGRADVLVLLAKVTVLVLASLGFTAAMKRTSAGTRHLVWVVTFASLILLPAMAARSPLRIPLLPSALAGDRPAASQDKAGPLSSIAGSSVVAPVESSGAVVPNTTQPASQSGNLPERKGIMAPLADLGTAKLLLLLWSIGVLACLAWLASGALAVRRIVRSGTTIDSPEWRTSLYEIADRIGLVEVPRLMSSTHVKMPFACGLFRPVIVLPVESEEWTAERRTAVLLHELAHVRRRDLVGHALGRVVCAFYWFHPLVWTAARRLRIESERACDDFALNCGARASDYAEHLLDIVTTIRQHTTPAIAMAMAQPREFEGRMLAILDPELSRRAPSRRQSALYISGLAMLALVVGAAAPASPSALPAAPANLAERSVIPAPSAGDSVRSMALRLTAPPPAATQPAARPAPSQSGNQVEDESSTIHVVTQPNVQTNVQTNVQEFENKSTSAVINSLLSSYGMSQVQQQGKNDERSRILINVLKTDKEASVRRIAAWGLNEYASEKAVSEALAEALRRDADAEVREMAAWALSEGAGDRVAVEALSYAVKQDADEKVRASAAWALGQSEDKSAVEVLLTVINDKNPKIRNAAIWGIGNLEPDRAPQAIITALNDSDTHVRRLAAWALYQIEDAAAAPALEAALSKETDKELRRAYLMALSTMGERSAAVISRLLESDDPDIRRMAVKALAGGHSMGPWPWPWPQPRPFP